MLKEHRNRLWRFWKGEGKFWSPKLSPLRQSCGTLKPRLPFSILRLPKLRYASLSLSLFISYWKYEWFYEAWKLNSFWVVSECVVWAFVVLVDWISLQDRTLQCFVRFYKFRVLKMCIWFCLSWCILWKCKLPSRIYNNLDVRHIGIVNAIVFKFSIY